MWYDAHRDTALAVLGAATGLASVLLVFVGFLLATAGSFPSDTDEKIPARYTRRAQLGTVPVVLCGILMLAAYWWLFRPDSIILLRAWSWGFPIITAVFVAYAIWAVREL